MSTYLHCPAATLFATQEMLLVIDIQITIRWNEIQSESTFNRMFNKEELELKFIPVLKWKNS